MLTVDLVPLSETEQNHEARVRAHIVDAIDAAGGWLPFDRFMAAALYAPGLGYYAAGAHKLGVGGDFVTAPELSPVFGRCLGSECGRILRALDGGDILEIGAGTGALAEQVMHTLAEADALPAHYWILETSPDLRQRQHSRLDRLPPEWRSRIAWLDAPPAAAFRGVILANEVIDALPIARIRGSTTGLQEVGVVREGATLRDASRPVSAAVRACVQQRGISLAAEQDAEVCCLLSDWVDEVTRSLSRGVALFIDYGDVRSRLYAADRAHGTLVAFHRHRIHNDPYIHLGLQDLTAWVDFTAVAEAGAAAGFEVAGYTTQSCFLLGCGFERHLAAYKAQLDADHEPLAARAALRLVLPHDMGERFKCIALSRDYEFELAGFSVRDFTDQL
jgi:SAM-dependent MidA family methyltransferase